MKKHEMNYYEYNDLISFHSQFCNHLRSSNHLFSERTKKNLSFSKEKFSDQLKVVVKNKKLLIFFEKTNSRTILKKSTSNQVVESVVRMLNESFKKLNKFSNKFIELSKRLNERRRINEF